MTVTRHDGLTREFKAHDTTEATALVLSRTYVARPRRRSVVVSVNAVRKYAGRTGACTVPPREFAERDTLQKYKRLLWRFRRYMAGSAAICGSSSVISSQSALLAT